MSTLISFLGKSASNAQTGYRTANYVFEPGFEREVPFFGMALLEYLKPQKLILAGTAGSMWDVFFDHQHTDDDGLLALMEAVPRQAVTPEMLTIHEQRLTEKLGIPVQCLLISYARDEAEQTAILTDLAGAISKGERIVLDVTHGFRHLPMLALVAARYLQHVRGVQVQEVYYGAAEMTDPSSKQTPVLRLGAMLHMLDWVEALAVYENSGNYGVFAPLLQQDGMQADRAHMLAQAAYFERSSNPVQAKQNLSGAHAHVREHQGPMGNLFRDTLTEHIGWFRHGSRADWELALADRYLARQDYLRTITYLCEAYISRATEKFGGNVNQFEDREEAFKEADKNQDVWLLKHLRNAMTHGVRTDNRDAKRLLQDQQALDSKLRALRKSLFL
ncbi:MAG: TIGR02221 family CRISPR-associated protein [Burkholderiaceae bacterium]|nr:TIGR02221 family CRISPR-associated protein [Burkholderiaceae bacterium]